MGNTLYFHLVKNSRSKYKIFSFAQIGVLNNFVVGLYLFYLVHL